VRLFNDFLEKARKVLAYRIFALLYGVWSLKMKANVIVFSTPTCSWCKKLKSYLRENGFSYKDIDVSKDQKAMNDMIRKTGQQGVPQMWINNQPVVGFDKTQINKLLGIMKNEKREIQE